MSDAWDLKEQFARIRRAQIETNKNAEDTRKFLREFHKLDPELLKLHAESLRRDVAWLNRGPKLSSWLGMAAVSRGIGGLVAGVVEILRLARVVP